MTKIISDVIAGDSSASSLREAGEARAARSRGRSIGECLAWGNEARREEGGHGATQAIGHGPEQFALVDGHRAVDADAGAQARTICFLSAGAARASTSRAASISAIPTEPAAGQLEPDAGPAQGAYTRGERAGRSLGRLLAGVCQCREHDGDRHGSGGMVVYFTDGGWARTKCVTTCLIKSRCRVNSNRVSLWSACTRASTQRIKS